MEQEYVGFRILQCSLTCTHCLLFTVYAKM